MAARTKASKVNPWQNRIVESGTVLASELLANPNNPRLHPLDQRAAMGASLTRVGWVARVVVNKRSGKIVDGHMRVELAEARGESVPVDWVDLSDEEEAEVLATMDPIGQMAQFDKTAMEDLTQQFDVAPELRAALSGLVSFEEDEPAVAPVTVELKPLQRAHILISVPLDMWDEVAELLDQFDGIEGVDIHSTVN